MKFDVDSIVKARRYVGPDEVIFCEGQLAGDAYVVLKGEVQIVTGREGEPQRLLNRVPAGELFGEIALLRDGTRTATAISREGCELLVLDRLLFTEKLGKADPFLRYVVEHLCHLIMVWTDRAARGDAGAQQT